MVRIGVGLRLPRSAVALIGERGGLFLILAVLMVIGAILRAWSLGTIGFNSDEAVYSGQAAALAGDPTYGDISTFL